MSTTARPDLTTPLATERVDRARAAGVHRGWALMVAAGLLAALANVAVLGAAGGGVAVVVVAGDHPAGTPVAALTTRVVTLDVEDPAGFRLVGPEALASDLAESVTAVRLGDGELLRVGDLREAAPDTRSAMSLPLEVGRAVGGALGRGDVVDVIAEVDGGVAVVARAVEVLAVLAPAEAGLAGASGGYVATVAVDDGQALALSSALRAGPVDVVRRGGVEGTPGG